MAARQTTNSSNLSGRKCFQCHGFGHTASDYPNRRIATLVEEQSEDDQHEAFIGSEHEEEHKEMTYAHQGMSIVV